MDIDNTVEQLEIYNNNYKWIIDESEKILNEIENLDNFNNNNKKYINLCKKLKELQIRFNHCKSEYDNLFKNINNYFQDKYGITLDPTSSNDI